MLLRDYCVEWGFQTEANPIQVEKGKSRWLLVFLNFYKFASAWKYWCSTSHENIQGIVAPLPDFCQCQRGLSFLLLPPSIPCTPFQRLLLSPLLHHYLARLSASCLIHRYLNFYPSPPMRVISTSTPLHQCSSTPLLWKPNRVPTITWPHVAPCHQSSPPSRPPPQLSAGNLGASSMPTRPLVNPNFEF